MASYDIPWGAWYAETTLPLAMPASWDVSVCGIEDGEALSEKEIRQALSNPIGTPQLEDIAKGKSNIVIAVEDITRPSQLEQVFEILLEKLHQAGVGKAQIRFMVCNGAHAPMLRDDLLLKFGKTVLEDYCVLNHNPYDNLVDTGIQLGKIPFKVNRYFYEADLKITIGSIMPHHFAGFSAGGKLVLPGLSDIATLERSHKFVMMGLRGGVNDVENNKFRTELEGVVREVGVDFFVGIVPNSKRAPSGIFAGDFVQAHRSGVEYGRKIYNTRVPLSADVLILNAYPKDSELLQADTAFTPLKSIKQDLVQDNGLIVLCSRSSNGIGHHSLFGPGMRLYKPPGKRRFLKNKQLMVFSPHVNTAEYHMVFNADYPLKKSWAEVVTDMQARFGTSCRVTVLPHAPLQLLSCLS